MSSSSESSIFTNFFLPFYPELVEDSSTSAASPDNLSSVLSLAYGPPILDLVASLSPKPPVGPDLHRSTQISAPPLYFMDCHCFFALATLYEPHTYRESYINPLW